MTSARGSARTRATGLAASQLRWRPLADRGGKGEQLLLGEARGDRSTADQRLAVTPSEFRECNHGEAAVGAPTRTYLHIPAADNRAAQNGHRNGAARPAPVELPLLLTAAQVEAALQLGRTRTYELLQSGEIPVRRVGRLIRVSRLALEQWVAQTEEVPRDG